MDTNSGAPGIDGLVSGAQWSSWRRNPCVRPHELPQLESINTLLNNEGQGPMLTACAFESHLGHAPSSWLLPTSNTGKPRGRRTPALSQTADEPDIDEEVIIPEMALVQNGGWMRPNNTFWHIIVKEFGREKLDRLEQYLFARSTRAVYGENHKSTRGRRTHEDNPPQYKSTSTENHQQQERVRRDRHRVLSKELDDCTPDAIYDVSEKLLPELRKAVKEMVDEEDIRRQQSSSIESKKQAASAPGKKTGKDDVLLAAALMAHFNALVVLRERQARLQGQDAIQTLKREIAYLQQILADTHAANRRSSIAPCAPSSTQLPLPIGGIKRKCAEPDSALSTPSTTTRLSSSQAVKRHRFGTDRLRPPQQVDVRQLPPSPSPSCDGCSSSFCSC